MFGFKKNNTQPRTFGPTKKMKNTYVVKLDGLMAQPELFSMCKSTPLPVIKKNGEQVQPNTGWLAATEFPNPGAADMAASYKALIPYMGKTASTIIEYLGRDGNPVAIMFPTMVYVFDDHEDDFMSYMNHATRRDFNRQIEMRQKALQEMEANAR